MTDRREVEKDSDGKSRMPAITTVIPTVTPFKISPFLILVHPLP